MTDYQDLVSGIVADTPEAQYMVVNLDAMTDGIEQIRDEVMQFGADQISARSISCLTGRRAVCSWAMPPWIAIA